MRVLGIDPGASGAIALISDKKLVGVWDMPVVTMKVGATNKKRLSPGLLAEIFALATNVDRAYIEEVSAMPKQGVSSTFAFGVSYGMPLGALAALQIPAQPIRPPEWRKIAGVRGGKDASRARAVELFPGDAGFFSRVKDDGRAEAALIAYAGFLLESGK